jgi:hypothetical protein
LRISFEARETSKVPNLTTGVCRNDSIAFGLALHTFSHSAETQRIGMKLTH